jgi:hypothetical protein
LTEEKNVPGKERQHLAVFVGKACHVLTMYKLSVTEMYIGSTSHRKVPPHTHTNTHHISKHTTFQILCCLSSPHLLLCHLCCCELIAFHR